MDGGSRGVGLLDYEEQSGLLAPIPRDPGYNYGSILPFRKPKAGGAAEWSPAYSELVKGVADAFTAPGRAYAGTMPAENMPFEAMNLAGNVQLASAGGLLGQGRLAAQPGTLGLTAYHGSPHKFDKFSMEKIGTGEGAQAYGHGLYFAENPAVAKQYQKANYFGERVRSAGESLYKVDIPDEHIAKMLDWDKPLSQQPESVRNVLRQHAQVIKGDDGFAIFLNGKPVDSFRTRSEAVAQLEGMTGSQLYSGLTPNAGERGASKQLRELGIPGIRYLDQGSRAGGQGTSNFVVFDETLPKILERK